MDVNEFMQKYNVRIKVQESRYDKMVHLDFNGEPIITFLFQLNGKGNVITKKIFKTYEMISLELIKDFDTIQF